MSQTFRQRTSPPKTLNLKAQKDFRIQISAPESSLREVSEETDEIINKPLTDDDWVVPVDNFRASVCTCVGKSEIPIPRKPIAKEEQEYRDQEELNFRYLLSFSEHAKRMGNLSSSWKLCEEMKKIPQDTSQGFLKRSTCYFSLGDIQASIKDIDAALAMQPESVDALMMKAKNHHFIGDYETALIYYERAKRRKPQLEAAKAGCTQVTEDITTDLKHLDEFLMLCPDIDQDNKSDI